jgi:hypothetical protein
MFTKEKVPASPLPPNPQTSTGKTVPLLSYDNPISETAYNNAKYAILSSNWVQK